MSGASAPRVCSCGRVHSRHRGRRQARRPADHAGLTASVYDALADSKASQREDGRWEVHYAGNCLDPVRIKRNSATGGLFVETAVRCRKCASCARAKMHYWAKLAQGHIRHTTGEGPEGERTWFGTLTLRPEAQQLALDAAIEDFMRDHSSSAVPDWWSDPHCDERFDRVRAVLVGELQRYWKRVRKTGVKVSYLVTFERHKSGLPHMHFLCHEQGSAVRAKVLLDKWTLGHGNVALLGGRSARRKGVKDPKAAAYYVAKYIAKCPMGRLLASQGYSNSPSKREVPTGT